jgi:hypothetical protein
MFNQCYAYGVRKDINPITQKSYGSPLCSNNPLSTDYGTNHSFIQFSITPMFDVGFNDQNNNVVTGDQLSSGDYSQYNQSMQNFIGYKPAPSGITDIFGFFSWVITGIRLLFNAFFMPLIGLPQFLMAEPFYLPAFMAGGLGVLIFILQISAAVEFATSRWLYQ